MRTIRGLVRQTIIRKRLAGTPTTPRLSGRYSRAGSKSHRSSVRQSAFRKSRKSKIMELNQKLQKEARIKVKKFNFFWIFFGPK